MANIIDGKALAEQIRNSIKQKVAKLKKKPGLAVVMVGEHPASKVYVNFKAKACEEVGFHSEEHKLPEDATEARVLQVIDQLNRDTNIHGILVQLPLPKHINEKNIQAAVSPSKDVDGFHPYNEGRLLIGDPTFIPCTPKGIIKLINSTGMQILGKNVAIVGKSNIVGKPISILLLNMGATITVCHRETKDLGGMTRQADILIVAAGKPGLISAEMVKEHAIVIDVGVNRVNDKVVGDVDFETVKEKAGFITPVPGGVGPMTIACLLENTLEAYERMEERKS